MIQVDELAQKMLELDEDTLKAQLGIHAQEVAQNFTTSSSSLETLDEMTAIPRGADISFGDRLFKRLNSKSYYLMCSDISDLLDKDQVLRQLKDAYEQSAGKAAGFLAPVLVANLGLTPAIAVIIAVLIVKTISSATAETICEIWKEKIDKSE